jgi:hypothetical protein
MPKYQDVYTLQFQNRDSLTSKPRQCKHKYCRHAEMLLGVWRCLRCHDLKQQRLNPGSICAAGW